MVPAPGFSCRGILVRLAILLAVGELVLAAAAPTGSTQVLDATQAQDLHIASNQSAGAEVHSAQDDQSWRSTFYPALLLVIAFAGLAYMLYLRKHFSDEGGEMDWVFNEVNLLAGSILHGFFQFVPWFALWFGWVSCESAMPWEAHVLYAVVLAVSMPGLSGILSIGVARCGRVPIFGCQGLCFALYHYATMTLRAADQYLDGASAVLAIKCDWYLAPAMTIVFFGGIVLQALFAALEGKCLRPPVPTNGEEGISIISAVLGLPLGNFVYSFCGVSPEFYVLQSGGAAYAKGYKAAMGIVVLLTENIPQAYLQVRFADDIKPSKVVYFSVSFSILMALKAAGEGLIWYVQWCRGKDGSEDQQEHEGLASEE